MLTATALPRFHRMPALSAILLVLSVMCSTQELNSFHRSVEHDLDRAAALLATAGEASALPAAVGGDSQLGPQPPCGMEPIPPYPSPENSTVVKSWGRSALGRDWKPPSCTGWTQVGFTSLVSIAARFQYEHGPEGLLRHVGAISELAGIRYWSTTHKQWRTFILDAYALRDSPVGQRRADFSAGELKAGKSFYFEQVDNLSGKTVYRMDMIDASTNRIVFDVENASTMRYHLIPILHPGELQSIYFLDRESENVWRFYSIVRTGKNASALIAGNESSSINRAVAFYRHMVGIPDTQEPPGSR